MKTKITSLLMLTILLSACSPKLDTSSTQAYKDSSNKIENSLNLTQQLWFKDAIITCESNDDCDISNFNGLTASEILEEGRKLKLKSMMNRNVPSIDKITQKIEEINSLIKSTKEQQDNIPEIIDKQKEAVEVINNVHILNSKLKKQKDYFNSYNIISFSVKNESVQAIKDIGTNCKLVSPGRSIPWIETSCNFSIDGGLESGETREIMLKPNMFSDLGQISIPSDSEFIMEITFIENATGEKYLNKIKLEDLNLIKSNLDKIMKNLDTIIGIYNDNLTKLKESENQFISECNESLSKYNDNIDIIYPNDIKGMLQKSQFEQKYLAQIEALNKVYSDKAEPIENENVKLKKEINTIMNSWKE